MIDWKNLERFEWDKGNLEHIKKHNVDYKECEQIFFNNPLLVNDDERHSLLEKRFRAYGKTDEERLLNIIFTIRESKIRVISARDQSKKERKEYQEKGGGSI